jgi:3-oxoacyl-[acyl-carrier-protein] synthase-1/3-oxoacyl-[acyl-carrier-protein] synthase II
LAAAHGLTSGFIPPTVGLGETDPEAAVTLVREPAPLSKAAALKVSAAFGGANAAIVLQTRRRSIDGTCFEEHPLKPHRQSRQRYGVRLAAVASAPSPDLSWLSERTGRPLEKLSRLDALCRWGLAAVAALHEKVNVHHAGLVCGHTFATASTNHAFYERLLRRGAAQGDPRAFPYTSPNALVGECAIAFQLTGPSLAVGGDLQGPLTALQVGVDFVSWGETPRMVVVAADDGGPCADALTHAMGFASMPPGAVALLLERDSAQETMPQSPFAKGSLKWPPLCTPELWGHRALEAWLSPFNGTETVAVG